MKVVVIFLGGGGGRVLTENGVRVSHNPYTCPPTQSTNMPFSHHSHSGQFCAHAENTLEEVIQTAIGKKMDLYAMTEHMPRDDEDLYPEEVNRTTCIKYALQLTWFLVDRIGIYCCEPCRTV